MANVLLIYPAMRVLAARFPYSVLPIAGALLEAGHRVKILDEQVEDPSTVDPGSFDVVGISTYSGPQITGALKAAARVRERAPGKLIVWGGVHPTITPHQTIRHPLVDIVVRGEGEKTLLNIMQAIDGDRSLEEVPGLTLMRDGQIVDTPDVEFIDLDSLPFLPYHLIKPERYIHFREKPTRVYFESSRGCPHDCAFCYNESVHRRRWRAKSVSRVLNELEYIIEYLGPDEIWPSDDNFSVDRKRVEEISRGKIERGLDFKWILSSRFDYAQKYDREFLELLKESGCDWLSFGGESGSQRILDMICKGITPEKMLSTVKHMKEFGLVCGVNFIAGFPGESQEELESTFDLIDRLVDIDKRLESGITIYSPFPETALYAKAVSGGFRDPGSLEKWGHFKFGVVDNLPWLDRRRRSLIRTVGLMASFDFTATRYRRRRILKGKLLKSLAYRIYNASARFRWRRRFFRPAPEWWLLDIALKYLGFWER